MYVDMYRNSFPYDNRRVMDCGLDDIETQMEFEREDGAKKTERKTVKSTLYAGMRASIQSAHVTEIVNVGSSATTMRGEGFSFFHF